VWQESKSEYSALRVTQVISGQSTATSAEHLTGQGVENGKEAERTETPNHRDGQADCSAGRLAGSVRWLGLHCSTLTDISAQNNHKMRDEGRLLWLWRTRTDWGNGLKWAGPQSKQHQAELQRIGRGTCRFCGFQRPSWKTRRKLPKHSAGETTCN